jgi:hypothetical protein
MLLALVTIIYTGIKNPTVQNGVENTKEKVNAGAKKERKLNEKLRDEMGVKNKE